MINRVFLMGRLASDPELRYTPSGLPVVNFRLAVNRLRPNQQTGEREADFFTIIAWQKTAEFVANYLSKGQLVVVDGRLQTRQWTTQEGQKRSVVEVVAFTVQGTGRPREGTPAEGTPARESPEAEEGPTGAPPGPVPEEPGAYDPFAEQ